MSSSSPLDVLPKPYDVAVDPNGNIQAAMYSNNHIAVYSEDGNLIDTCNLEGILQNPIALYIDGEGNRLIRHRQWCSPHC